MAANDRTAKWASALVVDDDPVSRILAVEVLETSGLHAVEVEDGVAALDFLSRELVDLVLLDVEMPRLDGFAVCERIRSEPRTAEIPVIMMTSHGDVESIQRAYSMGATDFAVKPVNWLILRERIGYVLRASQAFRDLEREKDKLTESQRIARLGSWALDVDAGKIQGSLEFERIYGLQTHPSVGFDAFLETMTRDDADAFRRAVREAVECQKGFSLDHRLVLADGSERIVHVLSRNPVVDADEETTLLEGISQDVTDRRRAAEQIRYMAFHDSLTGLGNHHLLRERLTNLLRGADRHDRTIALLSVGLDDVERLRDTLGPSAGDELLELVAARLDGSIRTEDALAGPHSSDAAASLSRTGGDEFTVLLGELRSADDAARVATRVVDCCTAPFTLERTAVRIGVSVGIAIGPLDGKDPETLIRNAGAAMHHARRAGRNRFEFFNRSINEQAERRFTLEHGLREAIRADGFELAYQPKLGFETGVIEGMETLVRWTHPALGPIGPDEFIPLAEQTGIIGDLSAWILSKACAQNRAWHEAGFRDLRVAVNVSAADLSDPMLASRVDKALRTTGLEPAHLELEITETALITNESTCRGVLDELKAIGVRIALDDFGTGYSSLSLLRRFPVDTVKIDRSFTADVESSPVDAGIVRAIVSLARALGLRVVAEGVETEGQRRFLASEGCDEEQGYLFSPAVDAETFLALLEETNAASETGKPRG